MQREFIRGLSDTTSSPLVEFNAEKLVLEKASGSSHLFLALNYTIRKLPIGVNGLYWSLTHKRSLKVLFT